MLYSIFCIFYKKIFILFIICSISNIIVVPHVNIVTYVNVSYRAVTIDAIIGVGGHIHIFMYTYRKNNRFQKKSVRQNTNIWICPPPPQLSRLVTALISCIHLTYEVFHLKCLRFTACLNFAWEMFLFQTDVGNFHVSDLCSVSVLDARHYFTISTRWPT